MSKDFDQLAAVLKSCGIVASQYDAKQMAESINDGVRQNSVYYADAYRRIIGTGKREETRYALPDTDSNITSQIHRDPQIENVPFEPETTIVSNAPVAEAAPVAEPVAVMESAPAAIICDEAAEIQVIADSIIREKEVESPSLKAVESPEQKVDMSEIPMISEHAQKPMVFDIEIMPIKETPANKSPEPIAAAPSQTSSAEDLQLLAKKMAEQMMQQMVAQQAAQQQALQAELAKQQQIIQQMNAQQAAMKEAMQKPAPQQAVVQERPKQQVFTYPLKQEAKQSSGYFREIPVDRNRPKPTLSKEEEKATDITKWFNFSGGRR